jgi:hypothetical protein
MILEGYSRIELMHHTLVITPPKTLFYIEVPSDSCSVSKQSTVGGRWKEFPPRAIRRFGAGDASPQLILICGYCRASLSASVDLFSILTMPIVEQFDAADELDLKLKAALAKLIAQEVETGAMTRSLLKQVLIALFRRSLTSVNQWVGACQDCCRIKSFYAATRDSTGEGGFSQT